MFMCVCVCGGGGWTENLRMTKKTSRTSETPRLTTELDVYEITPELKKTKTKKGNQCFFTQETSQLNTKHHYKALQKKNNIKSLTYKARKTKDKKKFQEALHEMGINELGGKNQEESIINFNIHCMCIDTTNYMQSRRINE